MFPRGTIDAHSFVFMINTRFLAGGVIAIFVLVTGSYFVISPQVRDGEMNSEGNDTVMTTDDSSYTVSNDSYENEYEDEEDEEENDDSEEGTASALSTTQTTTPTPTTPTTGTPTPTPAPAPAPTPTKTGYTLAEVAAHSTQSSCWTTINGSVYDLTSYISRHPGGEKNIMKVCGKDGAALFEDQHGGDSKPESRLDSLYIGDLI